MDTNLRQAIEDTVKEIEKRKSSATPTLTLIGGVLQHILKETQRLEEEHDKEMTKLLNDTLDNGQQ